MRWKQEAAARLQRQSLALSRSKPAKDLSAPLQAPCRPTALALEGLVDTQPRNKPFHKCRRNHDDDPLFAVALVLREERGVTSAAALHAAVNNLKAGLSMHSLPEGCGISYVDHAGAVINRTVF